MAPSFLNVISRQMNWTFEHRVRVRKDQCVRSNMDIHVILVKISPKAVFRGKIHRVWLYVEHYVRSNGDAVCRHDTSTMKKCFPFFYGGCVFIEWLSANGSISCQPPCSSAHAKECIVLFANFSKDLLFFCQVEDADLQDMSQLTIIRTQHRNPLNAWIEIMTRRNGRHDVVHHDSDFVHFFTGHKVTVHNLMIVHTKEKTLRLSHMVGIEEPKDRLQGIRSNGRFQCSVVSKTI